MNHYASTYRLREGFGFQAGHDLLRLRTVPLDAKTGADIAHHARIDGTRGVVIRQIPGGPDRRVSRPNCSPAYYLGRPASQWINVMKPRRSRTAAGHLA